jgi:sulfate adenylyltransferase subunit 2
MTMPLPTPKIADLNARRRRAVQLRVDGRPLEHIRLETGLSVPTILQAFRAFTAGGWRAIDVRTRGRPTGAGRVLPAPQEAALKAAVLGSAPPMSGALPNALWSPQAVRAWLAQRFGASLTPRGLARLLERIGLSFLLPRELDADLLSPAARQWVQQDWPQAQLRARQANARLLWCGLATLRGNDGPHHLWVAIAPRGNLLWLPAPAAPHTTDWADFLGRLVSHGRGACHLMLHGPDLAHAPVLRDWIAGQSPALSVQTSPIPPQPRHPVAAMPSSSAFDAPNRADGPAIAAPRSSSSSTTMDRPMNLTHLQRLEAESIHIMREVVSECEKPVMLYSIGKDSATMLHLARKAFFPSVPPFPLLHVDTTWKFRAMYEMRERTAQEAGMELLVHRNPEAQELGINPFDHGSQIHTDMWKTQGLKQALDKYGFDAAFGGARRDEEKSRAKERVFSFRSAQHRWDPKSQRPELWKLYNGRKHKGESIRVFPLSNWTELDIWQYIHLENIQIVPLYFAKERPVVDRDGTLIMVDDDRMPLKDGEVPMMKKVRFRTLGCYPLSGAIESEAESLTSIIQEMLLATTSERQGRMIDHDAAASMEKKKQEGYF